MSWGPRDRAGGREGTKSLRKNKQAIQEKVKNAGKQFRTFTKDAKSDPAPPIMLMEETSPLRYFDAACNLVSRRFESDQSRVIDRAEKSLVDAMVIITPNLDKQEEASDVAQQNSGHIYACLGVHPHNIKRTNDKLYQQHVDNLRSMSLEPEVVAIFSGLDLTREIGIHFPQEKMLIAQLNLAIQVGLPVVLVDIGATEVICNRLKEMKDSLLNTKVALYNFSGTEDELDRYRGLEPTQVYFMISGIVCEKHERGDALLNVVKSIPLDRLLVITASPDHTPQNMEDAYAMEQKNEPSNIPYIIAKIAHTIGKSSEELTKIVHDNACRFYNLKYAEPPKVEETEEEDEKAKKDSGKEKKVEKKVEKAEEASSVSSAAVSGGDDGDVKPTSYGCRECRYPLIQVVDVIAHHIGLERLSFMKRAKTSVEFDASNVMFVSENKWMKKQSEHDRRESAEGVLTQGLLSCPSCDSKLGKWYLPVEWEPGQVDDPIYLLTVKRVDLVVDINSQAMAKKMAQREAQLLGEEESDDEDGTNKKKKKAPKKNVKASNRSNMGNFRNKDF